MRWDNEEERKTWAFKFARNPYHTPHTTQKLTHHLAEPTIDEPTDPTTYEPCQTHWLGGSYQLDSCSGGGEWRRWMVGASTKGLLRERERERETEVWGVRIWDGFIRGEAMLEVRGRKFEIKGIWESEIRESCKKIYSYFLKYFILFLKLRNLKRKWFWF